MYGRIPYYFNGKYYLLNKCMISDNLYIGVRLTPCDKFNVDLMAILLAGENTLVDEADFVFYNSKNRTIKFDPNIFKNRRVWMNTTSIMSEDGSIILHQDFPVENEDMYLLSDSDLIQANLKQTAKYIDKVAICLSIYDDGRSLNDVKDAELIFYRYPTDEIILRKAIKISPSFDKFMVMGHFYRINNDEWEYADECKTYPTVVEYLDTLNISKDFN